MMLGQSSSGPEPSKFFHDFFVGDLEFLPDLSMSRANKTVREAYLNLFTNPARSDLLTGGVCDAILAFKETNGVKMHVLIAHINENWGAFSDPVPNRTVDWGKWEGHFKEEGCVMQDLWYYLNHTNVSAVFTTTHQWLDHPKIFSVPLGVSGTNILTKLHETRVPNRRKLLVINQSPTKHQREDDECNKCWRSDIEERVISNFNGSIKNEYIEYGNDNQFFEQLSTAKFILCPSGMGWDTYRTWEALVLGAIPILETFYRQDGFYRTFEGLPVLWVDHYDNVTPALLEDAYPKILLKAKEYNFAKLTNHWWVDFINSHRSGMKRQRKSLDSLIA
jgi:hypothetical protein